jgi:hypothetical protein
VVAPPVDVARETLTGVVGRALRQPVDDVGDWTAVPIGYAALNPISAGLYRVSGSARSGVNTLPWSVVLKLCRAPSEDDFANVAPDLRSTLLEALRWDREAEVYDSGLLETLPAGLVAPRCFLVERGEENARIWLEDITDDVGGWDVARYGLAARHLGRFNGPYLSGRAIPAYSWLSRNWLRDWVRYFTRTSGALLADDRVWSLPLTKELFPPDARTDMRRLFEQHDRWWHALVRLPLTLSHLDAFRANLLSRVGRDGVETVAVDWSFMGTAPLGAEVAHLVVASVFYHGDPADPEALATECLRGYELGLSEAGYRIRADDLRRAFVINAITRWGFILGPLAAAGDAEREAAVARRRGMPFRDALVPIAAKTRYLCALSREVVLN